VLGVTDWLTQQPETRDLPIGYFGASTGAAAALVAAAAQPSRAAAIVSRGGRPDLAASALLKVEAPTLLIVGSDDPVCLELNARAVRQLRCEKALRVISSASHLFEEPGALEQVSELATEWFCQHLSACSDRTSDQLPKLKSAE
jgi:putative phosphoribosyl transferase